MNRFLVSALFVAATLVSCKSEPTTEVTPLKVETDSLAYIIGMNIADNLMAMDSTINVAVVCRAIAERSAEQSLISSDDARDYYLRYLTYVEPERKRGYEEQYLEDLTKANRDFTRSKSGLTYKIEVIGDESLTPRGVNDLISVRYTVSRIDGEQIFSSYEAGDTLVVALKNMLGGMQESVKMIGKGGKVDAWIPSKLAYGEMGDSLLMVDPFETLYFEMELVDMERNAGRTLGK